MDDTQTLDRVAQELTSGEYFRRCAVSQRSRFTDWIILSRRDWSHAVTTIGRMAGDSDRLAQIASAILHKMPLYQTRHELCAAIYESAQAAVAKGYDNVVECAGPEPDRRSTKPFPLTTVVALAYWLKEATAPMDDTVPGVGWVVEALAKREQVYLPRLPILDEAAAKAAAYRAAR